MRLFRLLISAIGVAVIANVSAFAAELTLDDCISLALKNRESIVRARSSEELARAGKRAALGAFLPRVDAAYSYNKSKDMDVKSEQNMPTGYVDSITTDIIGADTAKDFHRYGTNYQKMDMPSPDQDRTGKSLSLSGSMSVFDLSSFYDYASAKAQHAAAKLDVIASEQDLIAAVKTSFYAYLATVQNVSVLEEAAKRSEEQLKLIQSKFDLGSASKSDVLKQKVQYGNDKLELLKARNGVTGAAASLSYTIGIDPRQDWQFSTQYTVRAFDGSLDSAIAFGLAHRPGLLSLEKSLSSSSRNLGSARAQYFPKLGASASYTLSDGTRGDTATYNYSSKSFSYGFRVSWNIFDGFLRERQVTQAKVARNNLQAGLADARNLTISEIKTAYLDIGQLKDQKSVAEENVAAATEDLKITQEKYNLGAATILDLLDAQVSLKRAEVSRISADFDLNLAISRLEKSMGKL